MVATTTSSSSSCHPRLMMSSSRLPTEDSLTSDCLIAPSYSEAMLAEEHTLLNFAPSAPSGPPEVATVDERIPRQEEEEGTLDRKAPTPIMPNHAQMGVSSASSSSTGSAASTTSVPYQYATTTQHLNRARDSRNSRHQATVPPQQSGGVASSEEGEEGRERRRRKYNLEDNSTHLNSHHRPPPPPPPPLAEPPSYEEVIAHLNEGIRLESDASYVITRAGDEEDQEEYEDEEANDGHPQSRRPSLKSAWSTLLGLLRVNNTSGSQRTAAMPGSTGREHHCRRLPRSLTDKDFFQKLLAAQLGPPTHHRALRRPPSCKTSSSYGDISPYNPVAHV